MNCQHCRKRLQDFLDETLEAAERAEISEHIASCDACRAELEALRKVAALVDSLDEVPAPEGFLQGVRARIENPTAWERLRRLFLRPVPARYSVAIPVIIMVFLAVFALMHLPPRVPREVSQVETPPSAEPTELAYWWETAPAHDGRVRWNRDGEPGAEETAEDTNFDIAGPSDDWGKPGGSVETESVHGELEEGPAEETLAAGALIENGAARGSLLRESASGKLEALGGDETGLRDRGRDELEEEALATEEPREPGRESGREGYKLGSLFAEKDKKAEGEQVIQLVVLDLARDQANVAQIAVEEGGQVTAVRTKANVISNLLVEVPLDNYDRTVSRLQGYNDRNQLTQQAQIEKETEGAQIVAGAKPPKALSQWPEPLPLIVRALTKEPAVATEPEPAEDAGSKEAE